MEANLFVMAEKKFTHLFDVCDDLIQQLCDDDDLNTINDYSMMRVLRERMRNLYYTNKICSDLLCILWNAKSTDTEIKKEIYKVANRVYNDLIFDYKQNLKHCDTYRYDDYRCVDFIHRWRDLCMFYMASYTDLANGVGITLEEG